MQVVYSICSRLGGGGIGNTAYQAVRGIYRHGYLKKVVARGAKRGEIERSRIVKVWYPKRVKLPYLTAKKWYYLESLYFDQRVSHLLKESCDIFHGWNGQCLHSLREAKRVGAVAIVERASSHISTQMRLIREEHEEQGIECEPELAEVIERCLAEYETADYIMVPSQFAYDSFIEEGFSSKKLILIPFGVDLVRFKPQPKPDSLFRILFVGRLSLRKGFQYLLEAWNRLDLKNAELVLAGDIAADSKKIIERYRTRKQFKHLGYRSDPVSLFNSASVFVCPSIEEGSALVTYEAMACGLPIITTANSGSVVRDGKDGFVIPIRDVEKIREKIELLYADEKMGLEIGQSARERVSGYTWEHYGDNLVKAYEKIIPLRDNPKLLSRYRKV
ncbi:glycosyltransferase family 4 protein [candidate division NPL-UPA2 bacterium]|nr:glycosyltransferase family 4 protein [candidate division NPL-UPA2 bacterium]